MINSKDEYALLCQSTHGYLKKHGHSIKLASVREAIAKALKFNSVSALLADLPVELHSEFVQSFNDLMYSNHLISIGFDMANFPFPASFPLSGSETDAVWRVFAERIHSEVSGHTFSQVAFMMGTGITVEGILKEPAPIGLEPNGKGNWYCRSHNAMSKNIDQISLVPAPQLSPAHLNQVVATISTNLKPVCFQYWNEHSKWCCVQAVSALTRSPICSEDGQAVLLDPFLDTTLEESFHQLAKWQSVAMNRFADMEPSAFLPVDSSSPECFEAKLFGGLVSKIQGHCILHQMYEDDDTSYQVLLWDVLEEVRPYDGNAKSNKYDFYRDIIWSDEFRLALHQLAQEWIVTLNDWSVPLRNLALKPFESPKKHDRSYLYQSSPFASCFEAKTGTKVFINPFGRGEDELGYHGNDDDDDALEYDEFDESQFLFDEDECRKELLELVEVGEIEECEIDELINELRAENDEEMEERRSEHNASLPFVSPFRIESLVIDNVDSDDALNFLAGGTYFSDLFTIAELAKHWDLMDSLRREFAELAQFIKQFVQVVDLDEYDVDEVFYVTDLIFTVDHDIEYAVSKLREGFDLMERSVEDCLIIINSEAIVDRNFFGAPYEGCHSLKMEYEQFAQKLVAALKKEFADAVYFS